MIAQSIKKYISEKFPLFQLCQLYISFLFVVFSSLSFNKFVTSRIGMLLLQKFESIPVIRFQSNVG